MEKQFLVEFNIQRGLRDGQGSDSIGQSLVQKSLSGHNDSEFVNAVGYFLLQTGQYKLLFTYIYQLATDQKAIPWGAMVSALAYLSEKIPSGYMDLILEGAEDQDQLNQVLPLRNLETFSPRFAEERKKYLKHLGEEYQKHKKALLDKIQYLKSQRIIDEEARVIEEFKAFFPLARDLDALNADFERRKAEHMISAMADKGDKKAPLRKPRPTPPPVELQPWISLLVKGCREKAKANPQAAVDLALMFYFFELYSEALAVISVAPETESVNWLRLELKVLSGRFVDAMEEARRLEQLYATDPESTFATTYARAQCLWELGQNSLAISLLQGIVSIRPYFRSAHSLLKQWTAENP